MIAVDTNIIVRLLTQDDAAQFAKSQQLFAEHDIFVADTVILECEWVLRFAYDYAPPQIASAFRKLFGLPNVSVANATRLKLIIQWHEQGMDFADAFHLGLSQQHPSLKTFDEKFIKAAKALGPCIVEKA